MGSFYSTCSISNVSICDGDDMVWLFLVPSWSRTMNKEKRYKSALSENEDNEGGLPPLDINDEDFLFKIYEKGLYVSNDGCTGLFSPFGFPIYGKYADYGTIEIDRKNTNSKNIKMLEDFFNLDIETLMDASSDTRWDKYSNKDSWALKTLDGGEIKNLEVLRNLTNTHFSKDVFDAVVKHGSENTYWFDLEKRIEDLCEGLEKNLNKLSKEELEEKIDNLQDSEDKNEKIYELYSYYSNKPLEYKCMIPSLCSFNFYELMKVSPSLKPSIRELFALQHGLTEGYILLRPSYYGSQEPNYKVMEVIQNAVGEVIEKQKEYFDEDDEDE